MGIFFKILFVDFGGFNQFFTDLGNWILIVSIDSSDLGNLVFINLFIGIDWGVE